MKIKIAENKYLMSDSYSCWITEEKVSAKTGKLTERKLAGYSYKLQDLFRSYLHKRIKTEDAETLSELSDRLDTIENEIKEMVGNLSFKDLEDKDV